MPAEASLPSLTVEYRPVQAVVSEPLLDRPYGGPGGRLVANRSIAVLRVPEVGSFSVRDGAHVAADPADDADPVDVRSVLSGTLYAFALAQRGVFALHAAAVDVRGSGLAICGPRGVGKSTLVLHLSHQGHALLADDLCPLELAEGDVMHRPAGRAPRVSEDTARALGLDLSRAHGSSTEGKLVMPAPDTQAGPVRAVIALRTAPSDEIAVRALPHTTAVGVLQEDAYRFRLLQPIWPVEMFRWAAGLANRVPVFEITRPVARWTVEELAEAIRRYVA